MTDPALLALYDALGPDDRAALDAALAEHPELAADARQWGALRAAVRADLARDLPDRSLLVLHALADEPGALSDEEARVLTEAGLALDAAIRRHPGLAAAVRRLRADREAFDAAWDDALGETTPPTSVDRPALRSVHTRPAEARPAPAADRPARPALRRVRPVRWAARLAAVVAVVAFGALATMLFQRDSGWETVAGAQTVTLADGSTVELAANARVMIPEDDARAARLLGGDALFRIVHDPSHPFTVSTANAEIAVLGTTFAVEASDVETEVVLVEGRVALSPRAKPDQAVTLAPGQASRVLALDAPSAPARADLGAIAVSRTVFVAEGTPVGEIARRLSERFDTAVEVDPELATEPMNAGEYGGDGLKDALDKLALALGADVLGDAAGYRIAQ